MKAILEKTVSVGGRNVIITISPDYQVSFKTSTSIDSHGYETSGYDRVNSSSKDALKVFRTVIGVVEEYIHSYHPPYIWYDTGDDRSRVSLYRYLAQKGEKLGYTHTEDKDGSYHILVKKM